MDYLQRHLEENLTHYQNSTVWMDTINNGTEWLNASGDNNGDAAAAQDYDVWTTLLSCASWFVVAMYCCCRQRAGTDTGTGDRIRRQARERWAREAAEKQREEQTEEKREQLVQLSLRSKRVISKDEAGNLQLGPVNNKTSAPGSATLPAKTCGCSTSYEDNEDEDEEQACVICLDCFEVDDLVSWSRHSPTCHHVFHTECIEPWLLERRQDDCPSCRSKLILYNYSDPDSPVKENLESLLSMSFDDDDEDQDEEEGGSIFVIMHGLIARAARQATAAATSSRRYSLVGTSDSMEEEDDDEEEEDEAKKPAASSKKTKPSTEDLPPPSPLRRVVSLEPEQSPEAASRRGSFRDYLFNPQKLLFSNAKDGMDEIPLRRVASEGRQQEPPPPTLPGLSGTSAAGLNQASSPQSPPAFLQRRSSTPNSSFLPRLMRPAGYQQTNNHNDDEPSEGECSSEDELEVQYGSMETTSSPSSSSSQTSENAPDADQV